MKIVDIFRRPIARKIEEIIHVDLAEEEAVASELEEYEVTDHIRESFERVLDRYQETINNPDEGTNIWVSGFFGSGKSSFAKVLGYLLADPTVVGRSASDRFLERAEAPKIDALLTTIRTQAPTKVILVDLSTGKDVLREGESVLLPLYRAFLEDLGYSRNIGLAELEIDLEADGDLEAFRQAFLGLPDGKGAWEDRRSVGLAKAEASHAMHLLRPETYSSADSWAKSAQDPEITANWFADRAADLLERRGDGAKRLVFVVDEVGQYVARSIDRMLDLQGLAESVQKKRGMLWLVVTSQEKLGDVVDSLESKQIELARVQDRFPIHVDLLPADIDEVVGKRLLEKSDAGRKGVLDEFRPHRNQLESNVRLNSPTRGGDFAEEDFVRLYPMLPYQIQLFIDAVTARRAQGGATMMLGGSNRTLIKLAQQLVTHHSVGIGEDDVGILARIDQAYDLLTSIIPTAWQAEIDRIGDRYGGSSLQVKIAKTAALTVDVPALPLDLNNFAALVHPAIDSESMRGGVEQALADLVTDEVVRQGEDGYRLQSPQEKDWEKTRKGLEPRPADDIRIRRQTIRDGLTGLSATSGRTFKVEVTVENEKVLDGDIPLMIQELDGERREALRAESREHAAEATIWWVYEPSADTYDAIVELHRSQQMIARKEAATKSAAEMELLGEERERARRWERAVATRLSRDLLKGQVVFRGTIDDISGDDLKSAAQGVVQGHLKTIYSRIDQFSAPVTKTDVMAVLRADDLAGLPNYLMDAGIGLVKVTPEGHVLAVDQDPLSAVLTEVNERAQYGTEATGGYLERKFLAPPFGASVEVVQALVAAGIRAGLVEATHQGARIVRPDDARLDRVLGTIPAFRAASFLPPPKGIGIEERAQLAEKLGQLTGTNPPVAAQPLAEEVRSLFRPDLAACDRVSAALRGVGVMLPEAVSRTADIAGRLTEGDDEDVIRTSLEAWADLTTGREIVRKLDAIASDGEALASIRAADAQVREGKEGLDSDAAGEIEALRDLLSAGDLAENVTQIKTLSTRIADMKRQAEGEATGQLTGQVSDAIRGLEEEFPSLEAATVQEALQPLRALAPADDNPAIVLATLRARSGSVAAVAANCRRTLQELVSQGQVAHVTVRELFAEPIVSEDDLSTALGRIREAVEKELAEDKQVWLE